MKHFCTNCGFGIEGGARFCESCGSPIAPVVPTPTPASAAASVAQGDVQKPKLKSRRPMWLIGGTALLAVLGATVAEYALPSRPISSALSGLAPSLAPRSDSPLYLVGKDGKWGYVDRSGAVVVPFEYDAPPPPVVAEAGRFRTFVIRSQPPYPVYKGGQWWLLDRRGERLSQVAFEDIRSHPKKDFVCARKAGLWGCVGGDGQLRIPFDHQQLRDAGVGLMSFQARDQWGLMDDQGNVLRAPTFKWPVYFYSETDAAMARYADDYGLVARNGTDVSEARFKIAATPSGAIWPIKKPDGWEFADLHGATRPEASLDRGIINLFRSNDGRFFASTAAGWGLVDIKGTWVVGPKRWLAFPRTFQEGRSVYGQQGAFGALDAAGQVVIPRVFDNLSSFWGGAAIAEFQGQDRVIDVNGSVVWPKGLAGYSPRQIKSSDILAAKWKAVRETRPAGMEASFLKGDLEYSGELVRGSTTGGASDIRAWKIADEPDGSITFGDMGKVRAMQVDELLELVSDNGKEVVLLSLGASDQSWVASRTKVTPPLSQRSAQAQSSGSVDSSGAADKVIETSVRHILDKEWSGACQFSVKIGELFLAFDMLPMSEPHIRNQDFDGYERFRAKGWIIIDRILNPGHMNNGKIRVSASPATVAISTPCKNANTNQFKFYSPAKYTFKRMVSVDRYKGGVDNFVVVSFTYDAQEEKNQIWQDYCSSFISKSITCTGNNNSRKAKLLLKLDKFSDSRPWKSVGGSDFSDIDKEFQQTM